MTQVTAELRPERFLRMAMQDLPRWLRWVIVCVLCMAIVGGLVLLLVD